MAVTAPCRRSFARLICVHQLIVLGMSTDPNPDDGSTTQLAKRSIMIADAHSEPILMTLEPTKMKRRVTRILPP
jgi:hypothetical protein